MLVWVAEPSHLARSRGSNQQQEEEMISLVYSIVPGSSVRLKDRPSCGFVNAGIVICDEKLC
jgi:hypothetical protein